MLRALNISKPSTEGFKDKKNSYSACLRSICYDHIRSISRWENAINDGEASRFDKKLSLIDFYHEKVNKSILKPDVNQKNTIEKMAPLSQAIVDYEKRFLDIRKSKQESSSILSFFFKKDIDYVQPKGFYMYGDVGSGKTMLMDLFLEGTPIKYKQRVHFNAFMLDFHDSLYKWRQNADYKSQPQIAAIENIANSILEKTPLLCFDEFQVTNIADAMILGRLFHVLWKNGAVIIATSNRPPDDLYKDGLQRDNFLPFIAELKERCDIHDISSDIDYRLSGTKTERIFINKKVDKTSIDSVWNRLSENRQGVPMEIQVHGTRKILAKRTLKGMARFTFSELCDAPMDASDYGCIASNFHTVFIDDIPVMDLSCTHLARRFIVLIDELYEHHVKIICSSEDEPENLFPMASKNSVNVSKSAEEEMFSFSRTVSRIFEMRTAEYLNGHHLKNVRERKAIIKKN